MKQGYLRGFFSIGVFIGGAGLILLFLEPRTSPEWTISLCSALMGGALILGAIAVSRLMK